MPVAWCLRRVTDWLDLKGDLSGRIKLTDVPAQLVRGRRPRGSVAMQQLFNAACSQS
jgi:hypothetical protein